MLSPTLDICMSSAGGCDLKPLVLHSLQAQELPSGPVVPLSVQRACSLSKNVRVRSTGDI